MFAKLLKHEWKATRGLLGIFSLAAVIAGGVGALALRFIVEYADKMANVTMDGMGVQIESAAIGGLGMLLAFVMLALVAYYLGTQIVLLARFYKNKFTDEGYLTFTLPVKTHQILGATWLNMLIWTVISALVVLLCVAVMLVGATSGVRLPGEDIWTDAFAYYGDAFDVINGYAGLTVLSAVVEWLLAPLIAMTCITIGAVAAKKHKILVAIAVYYGYSMVSGIVSTVVTAVVTIAGFQTGVESMLEMSAACGLLVQLLVALICWLLTNYLINNKLNLP